MFDYDKTRALELHRLCRKLKLPIISLSHNGADLKNDFKPGDPRISDPALWRGRKVVFVSRDIRDLMVSAYFHLHHRAGSYEGTLSEFIHREETGVRKALLARKRWHENLHEAESCLHVTYENMHKDPKAILLSVAEFAGLPVDDGIAEKAVDFCQAENMRALEAANFFRHGSMNARGRANKEAAKVREAKVGGHKNHLSSSDIAYIDEAVREIGDPFASSI